MIEFIVFLVLAVVVIFYNKIRNDCFFNASTVLTVPWCLALMFIGFSPYGLYKPSFYVYLISYVSIIVFNIVLSFGTVNLDYHINRDEIDGRINTILIFLLNIFVYVFAVPYVIKSLSYISKYGFGMLRGADLASIGQTTYSALLFQWVGLPVFTVTIIFSSIEIARKNTNYLLAIFSVIDVCIYAIVFGGRYIILKYIFYLLASLIILNEGKLRIIILKYKKYIIIGMFAFIVIIYLTSERSLSHMSFTGNLVGYYMGSFSLLSRLIESNVQGDYLGYGFITFGTIINFFLVLCNVVFNIDYLGSDVVFTSFAGDYFQIGDNIRTNSLPTMLYAFVLDYGKYMFWIGPLLFGIWAYYFEKKFYTQKSIRGFALYLFVLYSVFDSILVYDYISPGTTVTLLLIVLISLKVKFISIKRKNI